MILTLHCGVDPELEEKADALLMRDRQEHRVGGYHLDDLNGWLSEEQLDRRRSREIHNSLGYVGDYLIHGLYRRAYNPLLGRRPTPKNLALPGMDPWRQLLWETLGGDWAYHPGRMQYPANNIADRRPWPHDIQDNVIVGEQ